MDGLRNMAEAADWLGVPVGWVREKVAARAIPFTKLGKHVRFSTEHLEQIVAAGEQPIVTTPPRIATVRRVA